MLRTSLLLVPALLASLSVIACNATVEVPGGSAGAGGAGTSNGTSSGDGNPCYPDSCAGPSSGDGGPLVVCGTETCSKGFFCHSSLQTCGKQNPQGTAQLDCSPIPVNCPGVFEPVCGCDDKVYSNGCVANAAGVDLGGTCDAPEGMFQCGEGFCPIAGHFCNVDSQYAGGYSSCEPLPPECNGTAACDCVAVPCPSSTQCHADSKGGITVVCWSS